MKSFVNGILNIFIWIMIIAMIAGGVHYIRNFGNEDDKIVGGVNGIVDTVVDGVVDNVLNNGNSSNDISGGNTGSSTNDDLFFGDNEGYFEVSFDELGEGSAPDFPSAFNAKAGTTVTVLLKYPQTIVDEDWGTLQITRVFVEDQESGEWEIEADYIGNNQYSFVMPNHNVVVMVYHMYE